MARMVNAKVAVWNECHCCQMWPICEKCRRGVHPANATRYEAYCVDCWHAFCNKCSYCGLQGTAVMETMRECSKGNDCESPAEIGRICGSCIQGRLTGEAMKHSPIPGEPPIKIKMDTTICGCCNQVDCFGYNKKTRGETTYVVEDTPPVYTTPKHPKH